MSGNTLLNLVREGQIARLTLSAPDTGNKFHDDDVKALVAALGELEDCSVLLLDALGTDFCLGRRFSPGGDAPGNAQARRAAVQPFFGIQAALREATFATIAHVNGAAIGLGCALAGLCDIVIAETGASFQLPELDKNIVPTIAMHALGDRLSAAQLKFLVLSGETFPAVAARQIGLVDIVLTPELASQRCQDIARRLAAADSDVVNAIRRYARALAVDPAVNRDYATALFAVMNAR